ncbi:MAG TPA: S1 RNA-binding domain-containing protein [Candidatus Paceibacterota bacterium]|nr:S1 RNA-binding domain-containing protein [Candidatus Paceibacterota bacterium]
MATKEAVLDLSRDKAGTAASEDTVDTSLMGGLLERAATPPAPGDIVEGPVIALDRARLYIDLPPFGTGVIFGREYLNAREVIKRTNVGDRIAAKVISTDSKEGYIELSLKEARQAIIWAEAEEAVREKRLVEITVKEANKGGLILEWQGIAGFLPASQLKAEHYPRVADGDKDKILDELRKLVGAKLMVSIISATPKEGKLIFSEKGIDDKEKKELIANYQVGDTVEGEVTGMVDFGVFIKLEEGLEGLVHISEIDWGLVDDPRHFFKVGDKVRVKIIDIKDGKISLSVKALKENPWQTASDKYHKGDKVEGVVIKFNKHGALASIEEGIAGLVHVSEFGGEDKLRSNLELGKRYPFTISLFEPKDMRMALAFAGDKK